MLKQLCYCCVFLLWAVAASATASQQPQTLYSKILSEQRQFTVYLPKSYSAENPTKYPVMYLLDGPGHIDYAASTMQYLNQTGDMPELVIVGIGNTDRTRDMTPSKNEKFGPTSGGADKFLDFIEKELIPHINKHYSTADYRIFTGHSFGGLLALHSLTTRPKLFNGYFAFSPSVQWNYPETTDKVKQWLANGQDKSEFLYMSIGNEGDTMHKGWLEIKAALEKSAPKTLHWQAEHFAEESHGTVTVISQFKAYRGLFSNWAIDFEVIKQGLDAIISTTENRAKTFGLSALPEEDMINNAGYYFLQQPDGLEKARELFVYNLKTFPNSGNALDSLADLLEKEGKLEQALATMEKALKIADKKHENYDYFVKHHSRLKAALK